MKILFITSEAHPFIKVGGLGDIAGSLPPELLKMAEQQNQPLEIKMVLPYHPQINIDQKQVKLVGEIQVSSKAGSIPAEIYQVKDRGFKTYLIKSQYTEAAAQVYTGDNQIDGLKYIHFSLAALQLCRLLGWLPDILHAQDWHTAAAIYKINQFPDDDFFVHTKTLLTVHNLPYLGVGAQEAMEQFGLSPAADSGLPEWAQQIPLPAGLAFADWINTVSPGYAEEMLTEPFGSGLHKYLLAHKKKLSGILNGLDLESWDPATDKTIKANYSQKAFINGKKKNKAALQQNCGLSKASAIPLIGLVSRMDHQKGIDIAVEALHQIGRLDWQAVILGSGDLQIEQAALALMKKYPGRVSTKIGFLPKFARGIYAGADMFLIPSRYEPCGLTQMIAMRYGTIPIASRVGGLKDTIEDYQDGAGDGFLVDGISAKALAVRIGEALKVFEDQRAWRKIQKAGMKKDFSWGSSAEKYLLLYQNLIKELTL